MNITSFRATRGRRIGTFCVEGISLRKLTLIRNSKGEYRIYGDDWNNLVADIAKAALDFSEAQQHERS